MVVEEARPGRHQDRDHDHLGDHRTDGGVDPREAQIPDGDPLVEYRGLLVEDHPGHDDRPDVGRHQREVGGVAERLPHRQAAGQ